MQLWLVGEYRLKVAQGAVWDFNGIFDSEEKAIAACRDENYFIAPVTLNEAIHFDETRDFPSITYPLAGLKTA